MTTSEALAYAVAILITIFICALPFLLLGLIIALIVRTVKKNKRRKKQQEPSWYGTGWTWNEQKQLWEPPDYLNTHSETEYSFKGKDLPKDQPEAQQTHFHHDDTSFRAAQESKTTEQPKSHNTWTPPKWTPPEPPKDQYARSQTSKETGYHSKNLLTKNEWYQHQRLREYAAQKGLSVCPKVRLLDIVEPNHGQGYMTRFHKVQAKHVDFVLVDDSMRIRAIVELDDSSHDQQDRQERDKFVDQVLTSVGYTVIHTRYINEDTLKDI